MDSFKAHSINREEVEEEMEEVEEDTEKVEGEAKTKRKR